MKNTMFTKTMSALLIALLVLAILPVVPAYAAVAVPGQWSGVALIDNATASPQNATYAVPAGLNRLMVVSVMIEYVSPVPAQAITATYGGQALTLITQVSGQRQNSWVGYLNEAGIVAAADTTLTVTYDSTNLTAIAVHAATYSGVDQASPVAGSNSLYVSAANVITFGVNIPVVTDGYIFYVTNDNSGSATQPAGYTEHVDQAYTGFSKSVGSMAVLANGNENQTVNFSNTTRHALSVVSLNPAPADVIAPSITSFTLRTPASSPTNSDTLVFRVIFSEAVTNVNAADFAVNSTSTATVTGVNTINSSTYDITISGGDLAGFDGTVNLNLSGAQNITDIATNPLPAGEPATDQTYTVDNTAPTVSIGAPSVSLTSAGPVTFAITVSGANTINLTTADITLNSTGTATGTVSVTNGGTANPTVTINTITGNGTLGISIGAAIASDTAGNNSLAVGPSTTFTVDNTTLSVVINQAIAPQTDPTGISPINFTVVFNKAVADFIDSDVTLGGTAGATTATVTGGPTTYNVAVSGMTTSGTVTASLAANVATDGAANPNTASTSTDNNVTFSLAGPVVVVTNGINTVPDTGNGSLSEFEVTTVGITQFRVTFSQDVTNLGAGDPDSVTNPANYILVRDLGTTAGFQTVSCVAGGAAAPNDTSFAINSVSYTNGAGAGPFVATVNVNGGLPLSSGNYRLYVCGTTSITNLVGTALAGNGVAAGTDFIRNFTVAPVVAGGGGGGGGATSVAKATLPLTGFAPDKVTDLPAQPADVVYKSMGQMTIEVPTLGIKFPIVGAALSENSWDLTWLQNNVAYLEGSAYPTWMGNSVLTAHVTDANSNIGPFSDIKGMQIGDNIYVHDGYGLVYVYQVQENKKILASNTNSVFKHQQYNWVTLVTCEDFNAKTGLYTHRRIVRAVLISVIPEKK